MSNNEIKMFIDGKECVATRGDTILEAANKNGINSIPTLCWMKGLPSIGACRMCVVEQEGSTRMLTACTSPAEDGLRINTATEKLVEYRREILELFFAGRNHFCMFCSQSGDCELQTLAIQHGMDSVRFPFLYEEFDNDTSHPRIQADHNRCVLCERCVRTCEEKVGACTLALKNRGWGTTVAADFGGTIGQSDTCVECGACAQVCPTGTITLRDHAYRGRLKDCDSVVETICPICSMGCAIKAYVRTGSIVKVEGTNVSGPDAGQLCSSGRFGLPVSSEQPRVTKPMVRDGSKFKQVSWGEAIRLISEQLKKYKAGKLGALISSLATDEELAVFSSFKEALGVLKTASYKGSIMRGFCKGIEPFVEQGVRPFTAAHNILESDAIILLGADPQSTIPVAASYVRVAVLRKGAKLVYAGKDNSPFPALTDLRIESSDMLGAVRALKDNAELSDILEKSKRPIILLGYTVLSNPAAVTEAINFAISCKAFFGDGLGIVPLLGHSNALGAMNTVMSTESWLGDEEQDFLYVYSTGIVPESSKALKAMSCANFTVVQAPFMLPPLSNLADVILPAPAWFERSGHLCTLDGERRKVSKILEPISGLRGLGDVLQSICSAYGVKMETPSTSPCENVFVSRISPDLAKQVRVKEV